MWPPADLVAFDHFRGLWSLQVLSLGGLCLFFGLNLAASDHFADFYSLLIDVATCVIAAPVVVSV